MGIGIFCRKKNILTDEGIRSVKNLVIQIMLPVMIFNSLLSVDYSGDTVAQHHHMQGHEDDSDRGFFHKHGQQ